MYAFLRIVLTLLCFVLMQAARAQKITVTGQVSDSDSPLAGATVILLNPKDSSLVNFGATNATGHFEIRNVSKASYLLKITFIGHRTYSATIEPQTDVVDVGNVMMEIAQTKLDEVIIEDIVPVTVKKDTIEFNAGAFKTVQNATVEDLLKKMPGVEVDNDGTIRAQGEQVQRVTVDGKNFFGNDPKLATRNLPADAIKKVQMFDKKSDQATFSGIDDGQREKTINLELKEEKRNGAFGNIQGGIGTDDRYAARANVNRFQKGQQLSFLGMANNINQQGFSIDDYMSFTGGMQQMMSGRGGQIRIELNGNSQNGIPMNMGGRINGLMTNYAGGLNFNREFTKKTELNTSYFYNYIDHDIFQTTDRINYLPTGDLTFNQNTRQQNVNTNHRVNATLDHKLDSMNSLKWTNSVTYNETESNEKSNSENVLPDGTRLNRSDRQTYAAGSTTNINSTLLWRHKFAKKGRTLSTTAQVISSNGDREGRQDAVNTFNNAEGEQTETVRQVSEQKTTNTTYSGTLSYTEPLGNRKYIEANYTFRKNLNEVDKQVFDRTNEDLVFNNNLSNQYKSDYQYHRAGLNFRLNRSKYSITAGSSIQQTYLKGQLLLLQVRYQSPIRIYCR